MRPEGEKAATPCKDCGGTGKSKSEGDGSPRPCPKCKGTGRAGYQTK